MIGFIGLGIMGRPMARNLRKGGMDVVVHSRSRPPVDELVSLGATAATPAEIAARADVVITMLPDDAAVEAVFREMVPGLRSEMLVVDMGTTSPSLTRRIAADVERKGARFVDAPVSGGEPAAIEGTLSIMAGGEAADVERAMPVLRVLGKTVTHVGGIGAGQVTKAINQLVVIATIEIVAEALVLGAKAGVDPRRVRDALLGGFAGSRILDLHGRRMLEGDFKPGARAKIHRKDLASLREMSRELGVPLDSFEAAAKRLERLLAEGGADLDHAALATVLEREAGVSLSRTR
jgi:2-hydroxy-3-oxopropionate reductase